MTFIPPPHTSELPNLWGTPEEEVMRPLGYSEKQIKCTEQYRKDILSSGARLYRSRREETEPSKISPLEMEQIRDLQRKIDRILLKTPFTQTVWNVPCVSEKVASGVIPWLNGQGFHNVRILDKEATPILLHFESIHYI